MKTNYKGFNYEIANDNKSILYDDISYNISYEKEYLSDTIFNVNIYKTKNEIKSFLGFKKLKSISFNPVFMKEQNLGYIVLCEFLPISSVLDLDLCKVQITAKLTKMINKKIDEFYKEKNLKLIVKTLIE